MKKEITVYANRFTTRISTDIKDIIETARNAGDIKNYDDWVNDAFDTYDLLDLLDDYFVK